jgi:nucleoside 2-deoxyribosyltransferase
MSTVKPFAFVLMPFDKEFDDIYKFGIKKTAEELGILAERVDEQHFSETILERVYRQIENSNFIIADMTGKNPNVFYEVGYAHAKGKRCALITQSASDIPFDLKHHTHVIYDGTINDLSTKLRDKLAWLVDETAKENEQRISVYSKSGDGYIVATDYRHDGEFTLELTLRNKTVNRSPEIETYYFVTTRSWRMSVAGSECPYDDFIDDKGNKVRKHLLNSDVRRLAPSAFAKISPKFSREFWSKWNGEEKREEYSSAGVIEFEIVTSEGTLSYNLSIEVVFSQFPF